MKISYQLSKYTVATWATLYGRISRQSNHYSNQRCGIKIPMRLVSRIYCLSVIYIYVSGFSADALEQTQRESKKQKSHIQVDTSEGGWRRVFYRSWDQTNSVWAL